MAHFSTSVHSPMSVDEAFAYMADLTNFADWDPGVSKSVQVEGTEPAEGAAFDVDVDAPLGSITMRYEISEFAAPNRFVATAETTFLRSVDTVTVTPSTRPDAQALVTYDARLDLKHGLGLVDIALQQAFNRIGKKAAKGLEQALEALEGTRVS